MWNLKTTKIVGPHMDPVCFGPVWTSFAVSGIKYWVMSLNGWHFRPYWTIWDYIGPYWTMLDHIRFNCQRCWTISNQIHLYRYFAEISVFCHIFAPRRYTWAILSSKNRTKGPVLTGSTKQFLRNWWKGYIKNIFSEQFWRNWLKNEN